MGQKLSGLDFADYKLSNSQSSQPLFTPVRYSIVMGSGTGASAPMSYCAPGMCNSFEMTYKGTNWAGVQRFTSEGTVTTSNPEVNAGSVSLTHAVAASSAFLGGVCTSTATELAQEMIGSHWGVWTTSTGGANSFKDAQDGIQGLVDNKEVTKSSLKALSDQGLMAVIDGGYTDNTGISHALASGANEVVSFLVDEEDFFNLFAGGEKQINVAMGVYMIYFQIFQESMDAVKSQMNNFEQFAIGSSAYLKSIKYGTLSLTTVDCPAMGIDAGRSVTLHIISVDSSLSIGGLQDFRKYGSLVQEIVSAVMSNESQGTEKLLQFMLGQ